MSYRETVENILKTARKFPEVHTAFYGGVYTLSDRSDVEYSAIVVSPEEHQAIFDAEGNISYQFNIFYVDRQVADGSNKLEVQSHAIDVLNTLLDVVGEDTVITDYTINVFEEKFSELCAGAYATVSISSDMTFCNDYR